jgi:hypothetical protein
MRARAALVVSLLATTIALWPGAAEAHDTKVFQLCATFTPAGHYCLERITVARGDAVYLRAKVKPPHAGHPVEVQWQQPGRTQWNTFCPPVDDAPPCQQQLTLSDGGRVKTLWQTGAGSVDEDPFHFRFKVPDHGISNTVAVTVIKP